MVVEESRILQVSIFNTLQTNLGSVDFGTVLFDVMTITGELRLAAEAGDARFHGKPRLEGRRILISFAGENQMPNVFY
jgi:hypothetical protein